MLPDVLAGDYPEYIAIDSMRGTGFALSKSMNITKHSLPLLERLTARFPCVSFEEQTATVHIETQDGRYIIFGDGIGEIYESRKTWENGELPTGELKIGASEDIEAALIQSLPSAQLYRYAHPSKGEEDFRFTVLDATPNAVGALRARLVCVDRIAPIETIHHTELEKCAS